MSYSKEQWQMLEAEEARLEDLKSEAWLAQQTEEKSFIEKLQIEIDYMAGLVNEEEKNTALPGNPNITHLKSFMNGLVRAKCLFEGAPINVG